MLLRARFSSSRIRLWFDLGVALPVGLISRLVFFGFSSVGSLHGFLGILPLAKSNVLSSEVVSFA